MLVNVNIMLTKVKISQILHLPNLIFFLITLICDGDEKDDVVEV